jgi:hypothetical protein
LAADEEPGALGLELEFGLECEQLTATRTIAASETAWHALTGSWVMVFLSCSRTAVKTRDAS